MISNARLAILAQSRFDTSLTQLARLSLAQQIGLQDPGTRNRDLDGAGDAPFLCFDLSRSRTERTVNL